jgi:hypothetical protein
MTWLRRLVPDLSLQWPRQIMWDLWSTKWHWGRLPPIPSMSSANSHSMSRFTLINYPIKDAVQSRYAFTNCFRASMTGRILRVPLMFGLTVCLQVARQRMCRGPCTNHWVPLRPRVRQKRWSAWRHQTAMSPIRQALGSAPLTKELCKSRVNC